MSLKFKFNSFERAVGLFTFGALCIFIVTVIGLAAKQAWFENNVPYYVIYKEADGINPGTAVHVGGIKAGTVEEVEIQSDNSIKIFVEVKQNYADRIRTDSEAQIIRPFVISDKVINITLGSAGAPYQRDGGLLKGSDGVDVMSLFSGQKLGPYLKTMESLLGFVTRLVEQINQTNENFNVVAVYSELLPTMLQAKDAFSRVQKIQKDIGIAADEIKTLRKDFFLTKDMKRLVRNANSATFEMAELTQALNTLQPEFKQMVKDISILTPEAVKASPALVRMASESIETLREMTVVLKAMQKSWLLEEHVESVRKSMRRKRRRPATKKKKKKK